MKNLLLLFGKLLQPQDALGGRRPGLIKLSSLSRPAAIMPRIAGYSPAKAKEPWMSFSLVTTLWSTSKIHGNSCLQGPVCPFF